MPTASDRARFSIAAVSIVSAQLVLSFLLRDSTAFVDELEQLAQGRFFSSLYERQFSLHMPLGAALSFAWGHLFGFSVHSIRGLAAVLNAGILLALLELGRRYLSLAAGVIGATAYLLLESQLWAFLYLSEVPSVMFALFGTLALLRLDHPAPRTHRRALHALSAGVLFGLAVMARLLAVELELLVGLACIASRVAHRHGQPLSVRGLAADIGWVALGTLLPFLCFLALFAALGTVDSMLNWTLLYNLEAKGAVNPRAWVGDWRVHDIRVLGRFLIWAFVLSVVGFALYWRRQAVASRTALVTVWAGALGGWLGANPSGIGDLAFHAIPAFPFLGLASGAGLVGAVRWAREVQAPRRIRMMIATLCGVALSGALVSPLGATWRAAREPPEPYFEAAVRLGAYIREHSQPGDTLFIFGTNPLLYAASERNSATSFSIVFHETYRFEDRVLEQLERSRPRFIVFEPMRDGFFPLNLRGMPRVTRWILEHYRAHGDVPELLEPLGPENGRRYYTHPWLEELGLTVAP